MGILGPQRLPDERMAGGTTTEVCLHPAVETEAVEQNQTRRDC